MSRQFKIVVCLGPTCGDERNSSTLESEFRRIIGERGLDQVELSRESCFGRCTRGPTVLVEEILGPPVQTAGLATLPSRGNRTIYNFVRQADVAEIVEQHVEAGRPVKRLMERSLASLMGGKSDGDR